MKIQSFILVTVATVGLAQQITDTRTPSRRAGGGDGKCTIEVEVDDAAEVEISGNRAQIRTLGGAPATFRRFECNQDIPNNPNDFKFKGIDGRGRQTLVRSPGRGPAVIRIEDPKGGREGYTFDIFWRGAAGPWNNSDNGRNNNGNNNDGNNGGNSGIFGNGNGGGNNRDGNNGGGFGNGNSGGGYGKNKGRWKNDLNFRGRGEGYFRDDRNTNDRLSNCRVMINRNGQVEVSFETDRSYSINLTGRVQNVDGDRIYADMNGNNINGVMEIDTDGRNRVRNIVMRQNSGGNRFELSWHD